MVFSLPYDNKLISNYIKELIWKLNNKIVARILNLIKFMNKNKHFLVISSSKYKLIKVVLDQ